MRKAKVSWPKRPALIIALIVSIPAFYLVLAGSGAMYRHVGSALYAAAGMLVAIDLLTQRKMHHARAAQKEQLLDLVLLAGMFASAWPTGLPWTVLEWMGRLVFCSLVFLRFAMLISAWMAPRHLLQILGVSIALLAISGAGFYWLEPKVLTYADGLWLAFITGATVGYGDLVPSTPASRIFAVFIVLLGYTIFSVITASIAALFVGEDEKRFEKELHADIRSLREEITALRRQMNQSEGNDEQRKSSTEDK